MLCLDCYNEGYVMAYLRKPETQVSGAFAFRCSCIIGESKASGIPVWAPRFNKHFTMTVPKAKEAVEEVTQDAQAPTELPDIPEALEPVESLW